MSDPFSSSYNVVSLPNAMKAADLIRKHMANRSSMSSDNDDLLSRTFPPGTVPGVMGAVLTGVLLLPLRSVVLHRMITHSSIKHLADLILTPLSAMVAVQVGLLSLSLYGSQHYLREITAVPVHTPSPIRSVICHDILQQIPPQSSVISDLSLTTDPTTTMWSEEHSTGENNAGLSWDPRQVVLLEFQKTLNHCHQRNLNDKFEYTS